MILAYQLRQVNVDDKFFGSCICIRIPERNHSIGFYNTLQSVSYALPWWGGGGRGGRGVLPYKRLIGMCRWIFNGVSHFQIFGVRQFFLFTVSKRTRMFVL